MMLRPVLREPGTPGSGGSSGIDADAAAWGDAVVAAGGTYSVATLTAVSNFCKSAKAAAYWSKLNRINLFAGSSLTAALVPLKAGNGSATETNVNFVAGDYSLATGITGNASTKYLRTGMVTSTSLTANSTHVAIYNRSSAVSGSGLVGCSAGAASEVSLFAPFTDGKVYSRHYDTTSQLVTASAIGTPFGFIIGSRTSATSHVIYRNGVSIATSSASSGAIPALEAYVFARNLNSVADGFSGNAFGAYSIGAGLTDAEALAYNTHMETFQDALGRGVQ